MNCNFFGFHHGNWQIFNPTLTIRSYYLLSNCHLTISLLYSRVRSERNQSNNSSNNDVQSNRSGGTSNNLGSLVSNEIADGAGNNTGAASGNNEGGSSNSNSVRDSFSRWRDRQYYGPKRWFHSSREESAWDKEPGE